MRTLRCIARKVNGQTEVALPTLFLGVWEDGEERPINDDVAAIILGEAPNTTKSPLFEEVIPDVKPAAKPAIKTDAQPAPTVPAVDGGKS